jgi:hypothetical protein
MAICFLELLFQSYLFLSRWGRRSPSLESPSPASLLSNPRNSSPAALCLVGRAADSPSTMAQMRLILVFLLKKGPRDPHSQNRAWHLFCIPLYPLPPFLFTFVLSLLWPRVAQLLRMERNLHLSTVKRCTVDYV